MLGAVKFLVTRPVILPVGLLAGGLYYGSYKISKNVGTSIASTDPEQGGWMSTGIGMLSGVGVMSLRWILMPSKAEQAQMWQELTVSTLRRGQRLIVYNAGTLALSGIATGLAAAYSLPPKKTD